MIEVRTAQAGDREAFRSLWRVCFGDSEQFMDWFFTERYFPEFSACLLEDGALVSGMQSYPLHVRIRDRILPASMLAGVSTHPEKEGKGYMKRVFLHYMQRVRGLGLPVVVHTPAHIPTFFSRGHYPVTETKHLTVASARAGALPPALMRRDLYRDVGPLQACYQRATERYSGIVSRTAADFAYKMRDYAADGARVLARMENGDALGYCVYYASEDRVHAEECFALDAETLDLLLDGLCYEAAGRKLHVKLPPDIGVSRPGGEIAVRQQGSMGIADIGKTLKLLVDDPAYVFAIIDATVPQNAGVWDGAGNPSARAPQVRLEAGRMGQFLSGYRALSELAAEGQAELLDSGAARELDARFPKQICFITDEY